MPLTVRVGIIGGTGKEGRGLALRWARAGHALCLGSREAARAERQAREILQTLEHAPTTSEPADVAGGDNAWAVRSAEVVVLCVPYGAHRSTLTALAPELQGKLLVDITVPLQPPRVRVVSLPEGRSAALEAQALLGGGVRVVAALHHISAVHLADLEHAFDTDVLVCGDDDEARATALALVADLGVRALDAGPLQNAIALEALTPVLLHLNKRYGSKGCGLRITGLPPTPTKSA